MQVSKAEGVEVMQVRGLVLRPAFSVKPDGGRRGRRSAPVLV